MITSIPYTVNKATLVERVGALIGERKLPQVVDVRDESTADIRVVLELKPETEPTSRWPTCSSTPTCRSTST